jgi:hypothetical protein
MGLNGNFTNKCLEKNNIKIPIKYRQNNHEKFSFSVGPREKIIKNLPVSVYEGEILTKSGKLDNLYLPEILTYSKKGFAPLEVQNCTDKSISVTITKPIPVDSFETNLYEIFTFENFRENKNNFSKSSQNPDTLENLFRTDHMNSEEKTEIFKVCKEYSDIFLKPGDKLSFTSKIKHSIKTTDEIPVHTKSYRYPYIHKEEVQRQRNVRKRNNQTLM